MSFSKVPALTSRTAVSLADPTFKPGFSPRLVPSSVTPATGLQWRLGGHVEFPRRSLRTESESSDCAQNGSASDKGLDKASLGSTVQPTYTNLLQPHYPRRNMLPMHNPARRIPPAAPPTRPYQPVREYNYSKLSESSFHSSSSFAGPYPAARLSGLSSSQTIGGPGDVAMGAMEATLAALRDASVMAGRIPLISPVASLLLQVFTMRDASVSSSRRCHFLPVS